MITAMLVAVIPALALPWLLLPLRHSLLFAVAPTIPLAIVYTRAIAEKRPRFAASLALAWAVALSISTVAAAAVSPNSAMRAIWHAGAYRDEMLYWIATGSGTEGDLGRFLPRVLIEYALVVAISAATAGAGALLFGALLLGYMNGYVGWVLAHADPQTSPLASAFWAWPPWAMARVVSFVLAGTAGAAWGYPRIFDRRGARPSVRSILTGSLVLLAVDILLKWRLAPLWRGFLRALLGASAGIEAGGSG